MNRSITTRIMLLMGVSFVLSAFADNHNVEGTTQDQLCRLVITNNGTQMISFLNAADVRLYNNYRNIYCKPQVGFEGGSLLKTADHYGAKDVFDKLVQSIKVEDIFWEHPVDDNIRNTKIIAYKN
ncbi:MAG: hypothetical protein HWE13_09395 [Gammaproteobacteria bacterium]|nr:hypothetical protein [Gammaproteobacteria bacterium]NVK88330.1 hypothetical protein [Gammaproteobacteria bacterium]